MSMALLEMDTQLDSMNMSELRAFALGLDHDVSDRDTPLSTVAPRVNPDVQVNATTIPPPHYNLIPNPLHSQQLNHTRPSSESRISGSGIRGQRHYASQPDLPSTIPESLRSKMFGLDSQSEGDTQPVSPSVYNEFASRRTDQLAANEASGNHEDATPEEKVALGISHAGETGHIDLLGALEQPSLVNTENADLEHENDDVDPLSQAMDVRADPFPESKRFKQPKTPATNGKKRKREVETGSQEDTTTPGLPVNPFAGGIAAMDGMMGPSQLFRATQALTSPLANMVPSDGVSERPSPDMHLIQRPSSADPLSPAANASTLRTIRAVTEPQTTYVSMKASQEARERSVRAAEILSPDELSDDDFGSADTQLRRRSKKKRIDIEARNQFAGLKARASPVVPGYGRARVRRTKETPSRVNRRQTGEKASEPVLISDDGPMGDTQGNDSEDETEREEEVLTEDYDDVDELGGEENKENVEVPRTVSRVNHATTQLVNSQSTPSRRSPRKTSGESQTSRMVQVERSSQNIKSQEPVKAIDGMTQPDAIADSQNSQGLARLEQNPQSNVNTTLPRPHHSLDPRVLVPQSQSSQTSEVPGISHNRTRADSSSENVQSSPLLVKTMQNNAYLKGGQPGALVGQIQTEGPGEEVSGSEVTSRTTQELPASSALQSNPLEGQHVPARDPVPAQSTIPETDSSTRQTRIQNQSTEGFTNSMPSPRTTPKSASKAASSHSATEQSRPSTLFETAQENLTMSPSKSDPHRVQKASPPQQSPPKKKRLARTISEIAADPSPPDATGEIDVDINILSNEDIEFQNAVRRPSPVGPARKKRRGRQGLALQVPYQEPNQIPPTSRSPVQRSFTSDPPGSSAISPITPHPTSEADRSILVLSKPVTSKQASTRGDDILHPQTSPDAVPTPTTQAASVPGNAQLPTAPKVDRMPQAIETRNASAPAQLAAIETGVRSTDQEPNNVRAVTAPNRVFAHFNGSNPAYHPATCLEMIGVDEPRYRVRFEDGTVDVILAYRIKRLELRVGDVVKVDLPGARKLNYTVEGMQDQHVSSIARDPATPSRRCRTAPIDDSAFPEIDIYGNATVLVSPKQRQSVDGNQSGNLQIAVPLTLVYLTQTMWTNIKDRQYTHLPLKPQTMTGLQTPSDRPSTPSTPSSRTRRVKSSGLTRSLSATIGRATGGGIFTNMAFAITNIDRADENVRIKNHITSNGGSILTTGLDELFHIPALTRTTSPIDPNADTSFHLTPAAKDMSFTCLIADKHCRTVKFIQALSLGIPCLSTRWITHCAAKQRVLPWAPYLLPAGESAFLGGAVRSRILPSFDAETATLSDIIDNRPKMLRGASVLIIMEKGQEKIMQQHPLITHALGARKIFRAISEASAAKAVADAQALGEPWDWVLSYDKEREIEEKLFGGGSGGNTTGKKRKRGRDSDGGVSGSGGSTMKGKTRVVGNEFVIQSLILGVLMEE